MTTRPTRHPRLTPLQTIVVAALAVATCALLSARPRAGAADGADGGGATVRLFDGKSFDGWVTKDGKPVTTGWAVEDGCIVRNGHGGGDILTAEAYEDFELSFEFKISAGVNNGVKYRVRPYGPDLLGPEFQIIDEAGEAPEPGSETGALYALYETSPRRTLEPAGEWNRARVVADGGRIEHWLNGVKLLEADTGGDDWAARLARSKFARRTGFATGPGRIMLTDHAPHDPASPDKVWFRNLTLRRPR
jgi:hypothetical protein